MKLSKIGYRYILVQCHNILVIDCTLIVYVVEALDQFSEDRMWNKEIWICYVECMSKLFDVKEWFMYDEIGIQRCRWMICRVCENPIDLYVMPLYTKQSTILININPY